MKIYTQTGDEGNTSLLSGERVSKSHVRVKAYGETDELNSAIGVIVASLPIATEQIGQELQSIQSDLLHIGAWLSATPGSARLSQLTPISIDDSRRLEGLIDAKQAGLPELRGFILPGGSLPAAWAHVARTICRRTERRLIDLAITPEEQAADSTRLAPIMAYLNRLSDYLFVLARHLNQLAGTADLYWEG